MQSTNDVSATRPAFKKSTSYLSLTSLNVCAKNFDCFKLFSSKLPNRLCLSTISSRSGTGETTKILD